MLVANRFSGSGQWVETTIQEALHKRNAIYRCLKCNRVVVPHGQDGLPQFKHNTKSPICSKGYRKPESLSNYPSPKILVACDKCGWRVQYDRKAMLRVGGGDRPLYSLLNEIARRQGCKRVDQKQTNEPCAAVFPELSAAVFPELS